MMMVDNIQHIPRKLLPYALDAIISCLLTFNSATPLDL